MARPANSNQGVPLRVRSDAKCFYVESLYSQQLLVNKAIKMMIGIGTPMIQSNIERIRDSSVICRINGRIMMVSADVSVAGDLAFCAPRPMSTTQ